MVSTAAASRLTMKVAVRSDVGQRPNNEDAALATPRLIAIADGVGGAAAGEVASQIVIQAMASLECRRLGEALDEELRKSVHTADETLQFVISCRPELAGMASTLTAVALSNEGNYVIANVGDSRAYLFRDHTLRQLTRDDSLVQVLVDRGSITPEQARDHPQRSVVLETLDGGGRRDFELSFHDAMAGDRLLLCSDGLSDVISDHEIAQGLERSSRDSAADGLVDAALRAGGADNISVVVADVTGTRTEAAGWLEVLPTPAKD